MPRIYKRGRIWWVDYRHPKTGKRIRKSLKVTRKDQAKLLATREYAQALGIAPPEREPVWFLDAVERFIAYKEKTIRTAWRHRDGLMNIFRVMGGRDFLVQDIDERWIYEFIDRRLREGVKPSTVNRELTHLSSFLTWCVRRGYIDDNPCRKVPRLKEPPPRQDYLRPEEIRALLQTETTPHMRMAFLMAILTGMRRSEILALRRDDILESGHIRVRNPKNNQPRLIPIPETLRRELDEYLRTYDHGDQVFPWRGRERRTGRPTGFKNAWYAWLRRAGVRKVGFHITRHTFATYFLHHTGAVRELQALLGHSTWYVTQRYSHLIEEYRQRISKQIDESFAPVLEKPDLAHFGHNKNQVDSEKPLQ